MLGPGKEKFWTLLFALLTLLCIATHAFALKAWAETTYYGLFVALFFFTISQLRTATWADAITLFRLSLMVVFHSLFINKSWPPSLTLGLAMGILALDGIDGKVARSRRPTGHGAIFDTEADNFFQLTLALVLTTSFGLPAFTLLIPSMRPLYSVARYLRRQPVKTRSSFLGKAICVFSLSALIAGLTPLPLVSKTTLVALAVLALGYSFSTDFKRIFATKALTQE